MTGAGPTRNRHGACSNQRDSVRLSLNHAGAAAGTPAAGGASGFDREGRSLDEEAVFAGVGRRGEPGCCWRPPVAQIKVGVGGPLTGPNAAFGAQLKNGAEQAAADINAKGGINGQQIVLVFGDDASDPKQGVSVANKFVGDGVKFVIGHFNSGVTMPASEVYAENGIFMITPAATNPKITSAACGTCSAPAATTTAGRGRRPSTSPTSSRARRSPSSTTRPPTARAWPTRRAKAMQAVRRQGGALRGRQHRREGLRRAGLQDQGVGRRPRLLGRPAHRGRPARAPDARPGRQGAADGRRTASPPTSSPRSAAPAWRAR